MKLEPIAQTNWLGLSLQNAGPALVRHLILSSFHLQLGTYWVLLRETSPNTFECSKIGYHLKTTQ